jgi:hypothetical protein
MHKLLTQSKTWDSHGGEDDYHGVFGHDAMWS